VARRLQFSEALCASANRDRFDLRRAAPFFLMHSYLTPHLFPESPASLPPSATPRAQRAKPLLEKNDHNSRNAFKKQVFVWSAAALILQLQSPSDWLILMENHSGSMRPNLQ